MVCKRTCCDFLSRVSGRVCEKGFELEVAEVSGVRVRIGVRSVCVAATVPSVLILNSVEDDGEPHTFNTCPNCYNLQ